MTALAGAYVALPGTGLPIAEAARIRPFRVPLSIPPVMKPFKTDGDRDYYRVAMRKARADILPNKRTPIWGFDGRFPGPTFKVRSGREIVVRRINKLNVPATTHLHGGMVPWKSDGHPSFPIAPGQAYDFVYPNAQEAATLWYHDHLCKETSRNNYMGLSGMYIIEDETEDELNLPKGKYDIPIVLQDRSFKANGSFKFRDKVNNLFGDVYLVNGRPMPFLEVANRKYRFRILNGSHSRGYRLALDNGQPLTQIGSDQGLLGMPSPENSIPLWPSERAEVVIDFSMYEVGTKVVLQDLVDPADPSSAKPIMRFEVAREEIDDSSLPAVLRPVERLLPLPGTIEREFILDKDPNTNKWTINGKPFNASRIDIEPRLGDTEIWTFVNRSSMPHPMHTHLTRFQILDRSNAVLTPGELGWKDTVRVDASATATRIIMRFEGYTGRYMFHCHNLAHEDHSMMGQMRVRPGDATAQSEPPSFTGGYVTGGNKAALPYKCDLKR